MQKNSSKKETSEISPNHATSIAKNIIGSVSKLDKKIYKDNTEVKLNGDTASIRIYDEEKTYIITYKEARNYKTIDQSQANTQLGKEERALLAKKLYSEGKTQAEIANIVGCSQKTISNDLKK